MRQIVLNLLDNALKFGPPGQTVRLVVERVDDRACIAVEDEGPGIPEVDRGRIWSPYVRLRRERNASQEGSGIGLAVVRELTLLHGGTSSVEESSGGGARFVVELPLAAPTAANAREAPPARERSRDGTRERQSWAGRAKRRVARGLGGPVGRG